MTKKITSRIYHQEIGVERAEAAFVRRMDAGQTPDYLQALVYGLNRLTAAVLLVARAIATKEEEIEAP